MAAPETLLPATSAPHPFVGKKTDRCAGCGAVYAAGQHWRTI